MLPSGTLVIEDNDALVDDQPAGERVGGYQGQDAAARLDEIARAADHAIQSRYGIVNDSPAAIEHDGLVQGDIDRVSSEPPLKVMVLAPFPNAVFALMLIAPPLMVVPPM